jgi:MFS family permease
MNPEDRKNLRLNYTVNIFDGAFFGLGIGIASFTTVIPLFVYHMTDAAVLIGLISAVHVMGWQLPQLLMARSVSRLRRFKPMVLVMTIHERLPFLVLALIALFYQQLGTQPAIILTFLVLLWQGFGAGFTANAWQNMIAKVIPSDYLATFFGMQTAALNLMASGSAIAAGFILERQPFPINFAICFAAAFVMLMISYIAMALTRESEHEVPPLPEIPVPFLGSIREILQRDRNFRWFLIARTLVQFGTMAFSFYTVYAASRLMAGAYTVGILTSVLMIAQVVFNPLFGWVADRWSRKGVLEIGALAIFLSAIIARFAPSVSWMYPAMILAAVANTAYWTISMAMTLEFGSEVERPTYVGMANTLISPVTFAAPLIGGWLADASGYDTTFLIAAFAGILSVGVFHFFVKDTKKRQSNMAAGITPSGEVSA